MSAAARAALRSLLTGEICNVAAVRLPAGLYLPIPIAFAHATDEEAHATVVKDGGDDPDVTHGAEIRVRIRLYGKKPPGKTDSPGAGLASICLVGGEGVGRVTKPGLPVARGEPAINPTPRDMLRINLNEEWRRCRSGAARADCSPLEGWKAPQRPYVWIGEGPEESLASQGFVEVEITVPRGAELARHTLNPRLGILGGISILGTTGIVKPFSHEAYEETIQAALTVARSNGCERVVFSTGGKSEKFARRALESQPIESFIQVADFFAFSVQAAVRMGFKAIVHSVFFGKALKMAQGHAYTHAHKVAMDLDPLARLAAEAGYDSRTAQELADANTAQHALSLLLERGAADLIEAVARQAVAQSSRIAGPAMEIRLLLFDQGGQLLVDVRGK